MSRTASLRFVLLLFCRRHLPDVISYQVFSPVLRATCPPQPFHTDMIDVVTDILLRTGYYAPHYTRWFKYDRDKLRLVYTQIIPVIFEPPCILYCPKTQLTSLSLASVYRTVYGRIILKWIFERLDGGHRPDLSGSG
jgi:hypothetical protein